MHYTQKNMYIFIEEKKVVLKDFPQDFKLERFVSVVTGRVRKASHKALTLFYTQSTSRYLIS